MNSDPAGIYCGNTGRSNYYCIFLRRLRHISKERSFTRTGATCNKKGCIGIQNNILGKIINAHSDMN